MSTQSAFVWDESFAATADYRLKQYYFMKLSTSAAMTAVLAAAATDLCIGINQDKPNTGQAMAVRVLGISMVVSDGSGTNIAIGDRIGPNSSGKAVKKATADYNAAGIALDASTTDGAIIRILLIPGLVFRTLGG